LCDPHRPPRVARRTVGANLVDHGNTVIVNLHNLDAMKSAQSLLDLGSEGGQEGGFGAGGPFSRTGGGVRDET